MVVPVGNSHHPVRKPPPLVWVGRTRRTNKQKGRTTSRRHAHGIKTVQSPRGKAEKNPSRDCQQRAATTAAPTLAPASELARRRHSHHQRAISPRGLVPSHTQQAEADNTPHRVRRSPAAALPATRRHVATADDVVWHPPLSHRQVLERGEEEPPHTAGLPTAQTTILRFTRVCALRLDQGLPFFRVAWDLCNSKSSESAKTCAFAVPFFFRGKNLATPVRFFHYRAHKTVRGNQT